MILAKLIWRASICALLMSCIARADKVQFRVKTVGPSNKRWFSDPNDKNMVQICQGVGVDAAELKKVGLNDADLKKGLECYSADYDGNGEVDFLIFGSAPDAYPVPGLLIFVDKGKVDRSQIFPSTISLEPMPSWHRDRKKYPKYKTYGFIEPAQPEGGHTFFYDAKLRKFTEVPYIFPKGYDPE